MADRGTPGPRGAGVVCLQPDNRFSVNWRQSRSVVRFTNVTSVLEFHSLIASSMYFSTRPERLGSVNVRNNSVWPTTHGFLNRYVSSGRLQSHRGLCRSQSSLLLQHLFDRA